MRAIMMMRKHILQEHNLIDPVKSNENAELLPMRTQKKKDEHKLC